MNFYDKSGREISKDEFISIYNKQYKFEEQHIEDILENGIRSKEDIFIILTLIGFYQFTAH